MAQFTRIWFVAVLYGLMFIYAGATLYFQFSGIGSYDGWTAMGDGQGRMVITDFDPAGPARLLQKGDLFVAINGITGKTDFNIVNFSQRVKAGTPYRMTVRRGTQLIDFEFVTSAFPASKRGSEVSTYFRLGIRLLFLLVGLGVFLLRRDSYQAWLMAMLFGCLGGLMNEARPYEILGAMAESLISAARIIGFLGLPFFLLFFLHFPRTLPWVSTRRWLTLTILLPALVLILPSYGGNRLPLFFQPTYNKYALINWMNVRSWFSIPQALILIYLILGLIFLVLNYRAASVDERRRARVAVIGSSAGFLNILAVIALESLTFLQKLVPSGFAAASVTLLLTLPLIPLSFAYAIIRHKVIPVSLIIRRGVRYVLVKRGVVIFETLLAVCFAVAYVKVFFRSWNLWHVVFSALVGIAAWKLIDRLHRKFVAPVIDRKFFRQSYDAQRIIGELADSLRTARDLPHLFELLATNLQAALQTESVYVFMKDGASGEFRATYACEYDQASGRSINCQSDSSLAANAATINELNESEAPVELDWPSDNDGKPVWTDKTQSLYRFSGEELQVLQTLRPVLFLPLKVKGELSGFVALGARLGDLPFSSEDKRLVMSVGAPTGLALENARLIDQMIAEARRREEIEAENEARARELEEARQLQLSMLPKRLPELPNLEIAAYMKTATEVGGDYYDFHLSSDGTLTLAVGDATGHGLKAGTVVTAIKSLFHTHAHQTEMLPVFAQSSRVLKDMNLRSLFMALTMVKLTGNQLNLVSAGMPPALIYHSHSGKIEEVLMKSMPLGSMRNYPYTEKTFSLHSGDVVVLMSDGFPERFNAQGEMIGFDKAEDVLAKAFHLTPTQIIERFVQAEDEWAQGFAPNDDVTFVVLKIK